MKRSKRYIIITVSLLLAIVPYQITNSCGWYPYGGEYRFSLFRSDLAGLPAYRPFDFTIMHLDGLSVEDSVHYAAGEQASLKEWVAYHHRKVSRKAIGAILYDTSPNTFLEAIKADSSHSGKDTLWQNPWLLYLLRKDRETLDYVLFAKQCESQSLDPTWTEKKNDTLQMRALQRQGWLAYKKATRKHLKIRYAYQLVVLARYLEDYPQCVAMYDSLIKPLKHRSIVNNWALAHKATALYRLGKVAQANYFIAKVFDASDDKKVWAFQAFISDSLPQTLALTRNSHEKALILTLKELRNPGRSLASLKRIYRLEPSSQALELLLTREINKLEDWILTPRYTEFDPASGHEYVNRIYNKNYRLVKVVENFQHDLEYLYTVKSFVKQVLASQRLHSPALWNVAAAYLAFMENQSQEADHYLDEAEGATGKTSRIDVQIHLTRIMNQIRPGLTREANTEERLYREVRWMERNQRRIPNYERNFGHLMLVLSHHYLKADNRVMAGLLQSKVKSPIRFDSNRFSYNDNFGYSDDHAWEYSNYFYFFDEKANATDMASLIRLIEKKHKTSFQRWLTREAVKDKWRLKDLWGTMCLREDRLHEARAIYRSIPNLFWETDQYSYKHYLDSNPFYATLYSEHQWTMADTVCYNKRQVVEKLMDLKAQVKKGQQSAYALFLLGNAYYNMTYHGNSWMMTRYWWSGSEQPTKITKDTDIYYGCVRARQYYLQAMRQSKDKAFAALCCRMAGKCEQKRLSYRYCYYTQRNDYREPNLGDNAYFRMLKKQYGEFYEPLICECTTFDAFLAHRDGA